ncbi:hypothetical protein [Sphingomonas sp.]|uniref:hypothetical protein n=1 Tax=Sphingomonas sp. TaxID=28214 RepID=UPI0038A386B1
MLVFVALLAAQSIDAATAKADLDAIMSRTENVEKQTFDCMDREVKVQAKAHLIEGTPQSLVEGALASCSYLKKEYVDAATDPHGVVSASTAQSEADGWFAKIKDIYVTQVDKWMAQPQLADANMNVVIFHWKKCVGDKAADWSRLTDEASTVAQAAVSACNSFRPYLIRAVGYEYRSKGLRAADAGEVAEKLQADMKEYAVQVIISERAKRLPKVK